MMKPICRILFITTLFLSMIQKGSSIYCYYCNSANNSACIDLKAYDDETRARIIPIVNCDTAIPSPVAVNFFCRKIVQTIFHLDRDAEVRVTRGCGWVRHHTECYRADNQDHLETVCQCFNDHCNGADFLHPANTTILLICLAVVSYFYR